MNKDEQLFFKFLSKLAYMCNYELDEFTISLYDQALSPFGYESCAGAVMEIIMTRKSRDLFPSIMELKEKIDPRVNKRSDAIAVANRIIDTFGKWKLRYNKDPEQFKAWFIDLVGLKEWNTVQRMGGYKRLYEEWAMTDNLTAFRAQLRDSALSVLDHNEAAETKDRVSLGSSKLEQLVGTTIKTIK